MRIPRYAIVGVILSGVIVLGCGGEEEAKPVDLKGTSDNDNLKGMLDQQTKNLKGGPKMPKADSK